MSGACTLGNSGAPSICLLQDWCLAPSLGTLAGAASPGSPLPPDRRGTLRRLRPQRQCAVQAPEAPGRRRDLVGLGSRRPRGALCTTEPGAVHVLPTRTKSVSTIATWTSSGSTLLSESALGAGLPGQAPPFALRDDLVPSQPAQPRARLAQPSALARLSCQPRSGLQVKGVTRIPSEGLAQEKPNPRVSDPVEGRALPLSEMSRPEGLDT